nr:unnamed protein product [Callosobruchus analis]
MKHFNIPRNIVLADPQFNIPGKVDMLLGADLFYELLCRGQVKLGAGMPILQRTRLGWIISGPLACDIQSNRKTYCNFSQEIDIQQQLSQFWAIENISNEVPLSLEEKMCEEHFQNTTMRNEKGRFVVSIPLKDSLILWRTDPSLPLETYRLNTVTYGTKSAPYLATRCIQEIGISMKDSDPEISDVILNCFYVDDLLMGADTVADVVKVGLGVHRVLKDAGFELRKWNSNSKEILMHMGVESTKTNVCNINEKENFKALGLSWDNTKDNFVFHTEIHDCDRVTKRSMLSVIGQLFDPMGLASPCIIIAKIMLQKLWIEKSDWDSEVSDELTLSWVKLRSELKNLNELKVKRPVTCVRPARIELHGFADASAEAYGAAVYIRSVDSNGEIVVNLLCAKSKVTPIKTISIPRLELCAALVLTRLIEKVKHSITLKFEEIYCWTDSTVVLGWLKTMPNVLKTFIANRVSEIHTINDQHFWKRWNVEYVAELQKREKWCSNDNQVLEPGTLVIIKQDGMPPMKWKLGRVLSVSNDSEGVRRVAKIKTTDGEVKRAFSKICPLPIDC